VRTTWPRCALAVSFAAALPVASAAQGITVTGVVFDSIAGAPLAGARVQIASRDSSTGPTTATTDRTGRYRIAGLAAGRFVIGFYHETLDALGLDAPVREVELGTDAGVTVNLGIPSGPVVYALRCGTADGARTGMLAGLVRRDGGSVALAGAKVTAEWRAIALDSADMRAVTDRAVATTAADGTYSLCGLPAQAPLEVRVSAPGQRAISGYVSVPRAGVSRQDLLLVDSSAIHGAGRIAGRVEFSRGGLVKQGRAVIEALARDVPIENGAFHLLDLPRGTWTVEVRAIGVEPRSTLVNAAEGPVPLTRFTLDERSQRLDAVTVVGRRDRNSAVLQDVLDRSRSSFGTFFLPGHPALKDAWHAADVMKHARGFTFRSPTEIYGRRIGTIGNSMCSSVAVYLNGVILAGGFEALDNAVSVREILAIEAYPDVLFAPIQWRINRGLSSDPSKGPSSPCAIVLVWTKRP